MTRWRNERKRRQRFRNDRNSKEERRRCRKPERSINIGSKYRGDVVHCSNLIFTYSCAHRRYIAVSTQ